MKLPTLPRLANLGVVVLTFVAYLAPVVSPAAFWPLAFFGLLYPWLLLLHIGFILFWALRRHWYCFFSIGTILLGWTHLCSIVGWQSRSAPANATMAIAVTSLNAHSMKIYRQAGKVISPETLTQLIAKNPPNILCLQEFGSTQVHRDEQYANAIISGNELPHRYCRKGEELAIFSSYPILDAKVKHFNRTNGYLYVDLDVAARRIRVFNVHLQSNAVSSIAEQVAAEGDLQQKETWLQIRGMLARFKRAVQKRTLQAEEIALQIAASPYPVIVCGDLNDIPQSYAYYRLATGLQDAFKIRGRGLGFTYNGSIPGLRIDYIFAAPDFQIHQHVIRRSRFSDHDLVHSVLSLP
ncbi:MAG TPA: endonuclease/exonuclease/phosphatase family protein [Saprospiraceae bacterium]|nr:endonuclease/exonuclease/phosphatase family protein [Saprospiraceae bacterium]HMP13875.1 endonuclease/exonuclease/phosphatase family protein [Saprospiraceae bacterium]